MDVLDAMITNMVHVIDALARFGVLQFGQGGQFSADLSAALLHCEATVDRTRNWRLQVRNELNRLIDISSNSCRGNYSFLEVGLRQLFKGGNYSKEETIKLLIFVYII